MTKRFATLWLAAFFVAVVGSHPHAQQSAEAARKAAEKDKAAQEQFNKMLAEQTAIKAEAEARAQAKVAEEARKKAEEVARQEIARANDVVPIDVEIVISRFQGDKKVSSLPYALTVNAKDTSESNRPLTQLRMGGKVPLPTFQAPVGPDGKSPTGMVGGGPVSYEEVGTNIDARARPMGDGRFELTIMVADTAVAASQAPPSGGSALPVIRTFRSSNNLVLRDGQTRQFTAAADRITGEVVKVDVTLKVAK